jgi:D-serine deaminase-like pyridoxal phosphate-dependent protein
MNAHPISLLSTPSLVLDHARMQANIDRMRAKVGGAGVILRPHVKTGKCKEVALAMSGGAAGPITVSTLKEAQRFFEAGFIDILYAVGIVPSKLADVVSLRRVGCNLKITLDNLAAAQAVAQHAREAQLRLPTLVEIDCDGHRSGLKPEDPLLMDVSKALGENLEGVMTHAGDSYNQATVAAIEAMAEQERQAVVRAATRLRAAGMACPVVSVGSTPTATYGKSLDGVTEVRAGVFVFSIWSWRA